MDIQVLLFAALREKAGANRITVSLPDGATAADLRAAVAAACPALAGLLPRAAIALDEEYIVAADEACTPVRPGAMAALIPPVSGG